MIRIQINTEETKVNTLDINSYLQNDIPNSCRDYFANNYFRNKNKKFNKNLIAKNVKRFSSYHSLCLDKSKNKSYRDILGYCDIYKLKISKEKELKKPFNKPNLIKKIEFISFKKDINNNNKNSKQNLSFNLQELNNNNSSKNSKQKSLNNSKRILNISFKQKPNVKERKTYNYTNNTSTNNNNSINLKNKKRKLNLKKNYLCEAKFTKPYKDKNIKKIKIKKIDIIDKQNDIKNETNEKLFFNLNNDLERLIKENNLIKEKTNKKFRFCKSTRKISIQI